MANAKVVEVFPFSRPHPVAPSRDGINIAANTSFTRTQKCARPNTNRDRMNLNEGGAVQILSLLIEKKKKKKLLFFFNEIWKKRTPLSLFYSYLLVEVTKRISSNNNICKC